MAAAGVPVVPGSPETLENEERGSRDGDKIGLPIMIKAAAGGGGKGMRLVEDDKDLASAVRTVASEAKSSFGDGRFYVEKFVRKPAPYRGAGLRRQPRQHGPSVRARMLDSAPPPEGGGGVALAVRHARDAHERWARWRSGRRKAVELRGRRHDRVPGRRGPQFLLHGNEHPHPGRASGNRTGDRASIWSRRRSKSRPAAKLPFKPASCARTDGRSNAASMPRIRRRASCPRPGRIDDTAFPEGPGVRNDAGVYAGAEVSMFYDPMISKLAVLGRDRRMRRSAGCVGR